jgi:hypothetical protein
MRESREDVEGRISRRISSFEERRDVRGETPEYYRRY